MKRYNNDVTVAYSGDVLYMCVTTVVLSAVAEKKVGVALRPFFPPRFGHAPLWGMGDTK